MLRYLGMVGSVGKQRDMERLGVKGWDGGCIKEGVIAGAVIVVSG
jgi:hypothetical protein